MDVRCEKCLTVYELDDAKVGDLGLTVKCQECGNLFKVRRRADTAELVARADAPKADASPRTDKRTPVAGGAAAAASGDSAKREPAEDAIATAKSPAVPSAASEAGAATRGAATGGAATGGAALGRAMGRATGGAEERGWMLRSAVTREVVQFRELTTLQQWIVERKVTRADEISRGGESWKALGGIAELASFFHVVEQAEAVANASMPGLAVQAGAKVDAGFGAERIADLPTAVVKPVRYIEPVTRVDGQGPTAMGSSPGFELEEERRPRGGHGWAIAFLLLAVVAGGAVAGYVILRGDGKNAAAGEQVAAIVQRGQAAFALDTDDGFRQAISLLERAVEMDPNLIQAKVELGEAHITWAAYLLDDAHRLEQNGGSVAQTLRAEAQSHLERARRVLEEPAGADAQGSPALARAFADLLRVEGAPPAAVERYLMRAGEKSADDAELAYVQGALAEREGKTADASERLAEAVKRSQQKGGPGLARASYRIAALALAAGHKDEAARACDELFKISPRHDRGHALCSVQTADAAVTPPAAAFDLAPSAPLTKTGGTSLAPPVAATVKEGLPSDYKTLVRDANRLSENGKSVQARKLYERALELDPRGVAALTGLGYCDLDAERFMQSVDRFNAALAIDPTAGEAMLGLAESYKVRGQSGRALEMYKKYLSAHPTGHDASMAQKNVSELEQSATKEGAAESGQQKLNDKVQIKTRENGEGAEPTLPRPPPTEESSQ